MPSVSQKQAAFFKSLYGKPELAAHMKIDYAMVKEWVEADQQKGIKNLPLKKGPKTARSNQRKPKKGKK